MEDLPVPDVIKPYMPLIVGGVTAIVIFVAGIIAARWAHTLVARTLRRRKVDDSLVGFLASLARWAVLAATVIAALERVGLQTASLVALLGSAGIAVGLALQGNLAHFASGVMILMFRPFRVGDFVESSDKTGTVEAIGLFTTTLVTLDNETVVIPNGTITSSVLTNYTVRGSRRAHVGVGVAYGSSVPRVLEVLRGAADRCALVLRDPAPQVVFVGLGASALDFEVLVHCKPENYAALLHEVRTAVYEELAVAGIEIPFTQIVLHQAPPPTETMSAFKLAPALVLAPALLLAPALAFAAPPPDDPAIPKGTASQDAASSGSTELGTGDKFSAAKEVAAEDPDAAAAAEGEEGKPDPHANDATEFDIALGGIFSTGNSRTLAATGTSNFRLRRTIHQFGAAVAGNYGASGVEDSDRYETSVGNVQGLVRYDVFFAHDWTAFLQVTARHDTFQGLDYRMNVDPGFAYYAINKTNHRLWFEAGYDFQYDLRTDEARILLDDAGDPVLDVNGNEQIDPAIDKFLFNHAVRLYAGYSNKLSDKVSFDTGFEYLQSVLLAKRLRFNYLAALNTQLAERFSLAVTFTLRYENDPLPGVRKLDTITALSLAYRFF